MKVDLSKTQNTWLIQWPGQILACESAKQLNHLSHSFPSFVCGLHIFLLKNENRVRVLWSQFSGGKKSWFKF